MGFLHIIGKSIWLVIPISLMAMSSHCKSLKDSNWSKVSTGSKHKNHSFQMMIWWCEIVLLSLRHSYSRVIALIDHEQVMFNYEVN